MRLGLFLTLLALFGCGTALQTNTKLTVTVDLYDEDPSFSPPMSVLVAGELLRDLKDLETAAIRERNLRVDLNTESVSVFVAAWEQSGGDPQISNELRDRLDASLDGMAQPAAIFTDRVNEVRDDIEQYISDYENAFHDVRVGFQEIRSCKDAEGCTRRSAATANPRLGKDHVLRELPPELKAREHRIHRGITEVIANYWLQKDVRPRLQVPWSDLLNLINVQIQNADERKDNAAKVLAQQRLDAIQVTVASLNKRVRRYSGQSITQVRPNAAPGRSRELISSARLLAGELESFRNDLPANATSTTALSGLVQQSAKFIDQIDRLQDNSDAVWRVVTDPANDGHWNKEMVRTFFNSDGDSGVVIVRDGPMRFRIKSAENDPTATLKGQLEIARAITNASMSIAGAAAGIPTAGLASAATAGEGATPAAAVVDLSADFQELKASEKQKARISKQTLASLLRNLTSVSGKLQALEELDADEARADAYAKLMMQLEAVLNSHRRLLVGTDG